MGRKRKTGVQRDARGKSRGEPARDVKAVALAYRAREVGREHADDALSGFTLGKMLLRREIPQGWHDAGERWAALVRRHAVLMGYALSRPSPSFVMVANGLSCLPAPADDVVAAVRRDYADCYRALMDAGRAARQGTAIALICYAVCVDNRPSEQLSADDVANLRAGLRALARVMG
jgi:hypothetical protein